MRIPGSLLLSKRTLKNIQNRVYLKSKCMTSVYDKTASFYKMELAPGGPLLATAMRSIYEEAPIMSCTFASCQGGCVLYDPHGVYSEPFSWDTACGPRKRGLVRALAALDANTTVRTLSGGMPVVTWDLNRGDLLLYDQYTMRAIFPRVEARPHTWIEMEIEILDMIPQEADVEDPGREQVTLVA